MTIRVGEQESSRTSDVEIRASSERAWTVDGDVPAVVVGTIGGVYPPNVPWMVGRSGSSRKRYTKRILQSECFISW